MKAKLKSSNLNFDYYNVYSIKVDKVNDVDVGVNANVYKIADNISCYNVEINDVEPTFLLMVEKLCITDLKQSIQIFMELLSSINM